MIICFYLDFFKIFNVNRLRGVTFVLSSWVCFFRLDLGFVFRRFLVLDVRGWGVGKLDVLGLGWGGGLDRLGEGFFWLLEFFI